LVLNTLDVNDKFSSSESRRVDKTLTLNIGFSVGDFTISELWYEVVRNEASSEAKNDYNMKSSQREFTILIFVIALAATATMDLYNTMTTKALINMVQELKQEFSDNRMAFETKVISLETKVTSLETEVEGLKTKATILEASLQDLEKELHNERAKTDCPNLEKEKISELIQTVAHLEADVAVHALNTSVSDIVILKSFPLAFSNMYRQMVLQSVEAHLFSN
jgi:hypothetical protein